LEIDPVRSGVYLGLVLIIRIIKRYSTGQFPGRDSTAATTNYSNRPLFISMTNYMTVIHF